MIDELDDWSNAMCGEAGEDEPHADPVTNLLGFEMLAKVPRTVQTCDLPEGHL